ncbi:MAG: hypothetical protein V1887_02270 [Candidatus Aenigmatarchaeota archaeon]
MMEYVCGAVLFGGTVYGLADLVTFAYNLSESCPSPEKRKAIGPLSSLSKRRGHEAISDLMGDHL